MRQANDRLKLTGLRAKGYHGVFDFEKRQGQEFVVDIELCFDASQAARTDDLEHTIDYGVLAQEIVAIITGDPFDLIEALAEAIANRSLTHQLVAGVWVTVHKPSAPISAEFSDVSITLHRER